MIPLRTQLVGLVFGSLVLALAGCASVKYKSHSETPQAKPLDYPIPCYLPQQKVPRPCEVIGTVTIHGSEFDVAGGSADAEFIKLMRVAHEKGADAVKVTSTEKPKFINHNQSVTADLLRYSDQWEKIPMSKFQFQAYLDAHRQDLDPIEGIWFVDKPEHYSIAIMRNRSKPGRDFVGFILNHRSPVWPPGTKRIDIRRGLEAGSYILTVYFDDFASREAPIILGHNKTFRINMPIADRDTGDSEDYFVTYWRY
jgi:hypothetical protein